MIRLLVALSLSAMVVSVSPGQDKQPPLKDPTVLPEKFKELIKELAEKELQDRMPAIREEIRKLLQSEEKSARDRILAEDKERRLREEALINRHEAEIGKMVTALTKANTDLAKLQLDKDFRKQESEFIKRYETEVEKLKADLAKANIDVAKLQLDKDQRQHESDLAKRHEADSAKMREELTKATIDTAKAQFDKDQRQREAELAKRYEAEADKLKADLAKANFEMTKMAAFQLPSQIDPKTGVPNTGYSVTIKAPTATFRVVGLVANPDGKGSVSIELGTGNIRSFSVGDVFNVGGTDFRVDSVSASGAVLVVEQRVLVY